MFFKTLEIHGFKSFADKTVLNFDTKTTAVVGSNGNGKSNISDALRWVMGEQGAKTLRGEKMEDVIFHGTVERKPMGFAKVALTMDNKDRALAVDADEVVISRKLYRSGESEYLINGQKSRLKDIQELLMGTGLGRDGYSIIGQGRVADIVNSRGTQRREIFEEAAGISLFLHKKADAEKQLATAEENILRQRDIIRMDEERLPILEKQSEKARLAKELQDKRQELEISVSTAQLLNKREELKKLNDDLLLNRGEYEHYENDARKAQERIEKLADDKLGIQGSLERHRSGIQAANEELADKRTEIQLAENDLKHNEHRRGELTEQLKNAELSSRGFDGQIGEINEKIAAKRDEISGFDGEIERAKLELSEISEKSSRAGEEYSALEAGLAEAYRKKSEANIAISQAELAGNEAEAQKAAFLADLSESEEKTAQYTAEEDEARRSLERLSEERGGTENKLLGYQRLREGKKRRMDEARTALDEINAKLGEKQQRYKVLSDIEKSKDGYYRSVKEIITASEQGRLSGIHGIVADVISVSERYITAVETVLQSVMQNIIVDNEETANRCIRFLKETNAGRATLYPLTSMRGRSLNEPRLSSEQGFEGIASELVQCDDEYIEIIRNLLGTTVVVDDLSTATRIGKKYGYKFRIVTLDGQLVNAGGSFTGGSRINKSGSIISRKQEIESLYTEISKLRQTTREKEEAYNQYRSEVAKMDIEADGMQDRIREIDGEEIRVRAEISRLESLIEQLSRQGEASKQTLARFDAQIKQQGDIMEQNRASLTETSALIEELERKHFEQSSERKDAEEHIKALSDSIQELNIKRVTAAGEIEKLSAEIRNIESNRRMLLENSGGYKQAMEELDAADRELRENIERIKREIESGSDVLTEKSEEVERLNAEVLKLEKEINELHKTINEAASDKEKFSREVARLEERRNAVQRSYDTIVSLLFESYELTVSQAVERVTLPENLMVAENELAELKKRISGLGMVNLAAIDEYIEVSRRYKFQTEQLADIERSKRELEKLIEQLTADIKARFLNSFEDINTHFKEIFVKIFGDGAHAELELTDPEDVLNSGIEIKAAPPGKVIKNLISLSGGEQTMVAITIYFAILMHRPTPFCMLDEVDAALDDINVDKYISYLSQFSNHTQLMVITHRRGTIEGCDVLYGVFMQEKGVSRLLRRELTDELDVELK